MFIFYILNGFSLYFLRITYPLNPDVCVLIHLVVFGILAYKWPSILGIDLLLDIVDNSKNASFHRAGGNAILQLGKYTLNWRKL